MIGASLAGLFAAAAAADAGCRVLVLERDSLPDAPTPRRGVPQGHQPHVLLRRGLAAADQLLPDLTGDLVRAGGVPFDTGDLPWLGEHGWLRTGRPQFPVVSATRPLVEHIVRRRVSALPGVRILDGATVNRISRRGSHWSVGVGDGGEQLADLVIDASGRNSRMATWLEALGVGPVRTTQVDAGAGYATRMYVGEPGADIPGVVVLATPQSLTGGLALRVENGRWLMLAVGFGQHRPPRDPAGFEAFISELRDPAVADLATRLDPVGDVRVYRQTANRRQHLTQIRDWPDGLVVIGDAMCSFNPVYGQGITVAACEAVLLRRELRDRTPVRSVTLFTRRLLSGFARVQSLPWAIATGEDLRYPTSRGRGGLAQRMFNSWAQEVGILAAHGNGRAQDTFARVYHLMGSPALLFDPRLGYAVARAHLGRQGTPVPRPTELDALRS